MESDYVYYLAREYIQLYLNQALWNVRMYF